MKLGHQCKGQKGLAGWLASSHLFTMGWGQRPFSIVS